MVGGGAARRSRETRPDGQIRLWALLGQDSSLGDVDRSMRVLGDLFVMRYQQDGAACGGELCQGVEDVVADHVGRFGDAREIRVSIGLTNQFEVLEEKAVGALRQGESQLSEAVEEG